MILAALLAGSVALLSWLERGPVEPGRSHSPLAHEIRPAAEVSPLGADHQTVPASPSDPDWVDAGPPAPRIAIIIDDVGYLERPALELAGMGLPLTFAILPFQRYSRSLTDKLSASGHEVILHLPMEPEGYPLNNAGKGMVGPEMRVGEITLILEKALRDVPHASGISNHMGSRATADPVLMKTVLGLLLRRGLYFLDSRTTADSVAFQMARKMGVPALQRAIFLDGKRDESYIENQFRNLLLEARANGSAVAIGHPYPATIAVLKRSAALLQREGVRLVPASELAGPERGARADALAEDDRTIRDPRRDRSGIDGRGVQGP
ncbi:MAG: divergent polysaccharide deacetylase family protein [Acidobacteria bacterium]|nr:divergent polysaccharide deacetylase family protein [Acidobacteriota bacterium]